MKSVEDTINNIDEDLDLQYDSVIEMLQEAKEKKLPIDEGLFGSILGGVAGAAVGPKIMTAVCKALGVDVNGQFGKLLTSRMIIAAVGALVGWKS